MLRGLEYYYRPATIEEALKLLTDESRRNVVLGGGSILAFSNFPGIEGLIEIGALGLNAIEDREDCLHIGAACTIRQIQRAPESAKYFSGVLRRAARNYLTALIRNQAQLGGILACVFNADIVGALFALDATLHFYGPEGEKDLSMDEVYQENPSRYFEQSILTGVTIAKQGQRMSYHRIAKTATDASIISVFVSLEEDHVGLVVNSAGPLPVRLRATEELLGADILDFGRIEESMEGLKTVSDIRASADYRKEMAKVLVKRAISEVRA